MMLRRRWARLAVPFALAFAAHCGSDVAKDSTDPPTVGDGGSGGIWTSAHAGTTQSGCAHDGCSVGAPLDPSCDPCAQAVCSKHPECCEGGWDDACVTSALAARGCDCGIVGAGGGDGDDGTVAGAGGEMASGGGSGTLCNHDACTVGEPLGTTCDACTAAVCADEPSCCDEAWGEDCIADATTYTACPVCSTCGHSVCEPGLPLKKSCGDACITAVCAKIDTCCSVAWDAYCVGLAQDCTECAAAGGSGGSTAGGSGGAPSEAGSGGAPITSAGAGGTIDDGGSGGAIDVGGSGGSGDGDDGGSGGTIAAGGSSSGCGAPVINEVCPGDTSATDEFIELYNANACDISLAGFQLKVISSTGNPLATNPIWVGAADATIAAGAYYRVSTAGTGEVHMKQSLSTSSSLALFAQATDNAPLDAVAWGAIPAASLSLVYVEGTPVSNGVALPKTNHASVARVTAGVDTNDNSVDFAVGVPSAAK